MPSVPSAFRGVPASPEPARCFPACSSRALATSDPARQEASAGGKHQCSRNGARRQELPPERGAGSVSSRAAERPERPASPPLPPSRWPAWGHPSWFHRKSLSPAAVELAEDRAWPCFGVPVLTGLEGSLTDVPSAKLTLLRGYKRD